jgi:hypothetical protein
MNSGWPIKIIWIAILILVLSPILSARVEFQRSPLFYPVYADKGSDDFDEFEDENKTKEKKKPKEGPNKTEFQMDTGKEKHISRTKAVFLSLVFPGAGHYYAGEKGRAEVFAGFEVATWVSALAFHTYGEWKKDDYVNIAKSHAGIIEADQGDEFYKNLAFYENRDDYNTAGRIINPGAPYYPNTRDYYWQWDETASRKEYRSVRNSSESAFRKATFMVGVAVFNRIVAGIDTFRILRKIKTEVKEDEFSSKEKEGIKFKVKANPFGDNPGIKLAVSRQF